MTFISNNVFRVLGWEAQQFLEDSRFWVNRIHPEDRQQVLAQLARLPEENVVLIEYRFLHKDKTYRWFYEQAKLIRDEAGNYIAIGSRGNLFLTWAPGQDYWVPHNRGSSRRIQNMGYIGGDAKKGLWMTLNGGAMLVSDISLVILCLIDFFR